MSVQPAPDAIAALTARNPFERFPDGRPRVPDDLLERLRLVTTEEAWGVLREHGYPRQFEGGWLRDPSGPDHRRAGGHGPVPAASAGPPRGRPAGRRGGRPLGGRPPELVDHRVARAGRRDGRRHLRQGQGRARSSATTWARRSASAPGRARSSTAASATTRASCSSRASTSTSAASTRRRSPTSPSTASTSRSGSAASPCCRAMWCSARRPA